jgi:DNA methylase
METRGGRPLVGEDVRPLHDAFFSARRVGGLTHNIYRYPARFSPEFVRAALDSFSDPGDLILDPFMGGGTSAVEALVSGRRFLGFDINPLSVLLTRAKTTPLSQRDRVALRAWVERSFDSSSRRVPGETRLKNAPALIVDALSGPVGSVDMLETDRQRDAARAILLGVGQWAIDGRSAPVPADDLHAVAADHLERLLAGLDSLAVTARQSGLPPGQLPRNRVIRSSAAREAAGSRGLNRMVGRVRLVVTSPPYPGVHVLYHRWQVLGRSETPMPYWIADLQDGLGPKHYTMGGRSALGQDSYFREMRSTWSAVRRLLRPDAVIIQLVAFSKPETQVERYQAMMAEAGFHSVPALEPRDSREVPNRRWYHRIEPDRIQSKEALMVHRVSR